MQIHKDTIARVLATTLGEGAYRIVETLFDHGIDAWWVGGPVRDMLLGHTPKDIDIATSADPLQIQSIFAKSSVKNAELGTCTVTAKGHEYDVTTFRKEGEYKTGRQPDTVSFTTKEEDAKRRDFTVNAIYFHPITSDVFDPYNGLADLNEKLVRIIGDPAKRLQEDPLRLLRAVRFKTQLNGQYDPATFQALHSQATLASSLSGSLVLTELKKILESDHPERGFEDLWETDILEYLVPELHRCKGIPQPKDFHQEGDVWNHTMQCLQALQAEDSIAVRLAILFHDIGKAETFSITDRIHFDEHASKSGDIAQSILKRLQCPKQLREEVNWLIRHHMMMQDFFRMNNKRKATWYHHDWFPELMRVFWLDIAGTSPSNFDLYERIKADYQEFTDQFPKPLQPLLNGDDIIALTGLSGGEKIGQLLHSIEEAQHEGTIKSRAEAEKLVLELFQQ